MAVSYPVKRLRHDIDEEIVRFSMEPMQKITALDVLSDMQFAFKEALRALREHPAALSGEISVRLLGRCLEVTDERTGEVVTIPVLQ